MKPNLTKTLIFILFFIVGWLLAGCGEVTVADSPIGQLLSGEHALNELQIEKSADENAEVTVNKPVYFLFSNTSMMFNVTLNDSNVVTMTLPVSRVRFRYDETVTQPYVKFKWMKGGSEFDIAHITDHILYMVLFVKKEDVVYHPTIIEN